MNNNAQPPLIARPRAALFLPALLLLFAGSGCAALIYEIVWYQLLEFVIGSSAISLGILLATFMGGLCLGSLFVPRSRIVRRHGPLQVYALIELGIGLCGILVLWGVPLISRIYVANFGYGIRSILLRAAVCAVCLLVPTMLMGASLPVIARWVETTPRGAAWLGALYACNTLGAVFGCLLAGFYLLRVFDLATATCVAAAINAGVALCGLALSVSSAKEVAEAPGASAPPASSLLGSNSDEMRVYAAIAISGACALGAEVIWTRLLGLMLGATVYTFSIILAVFLAGLAIGSGIGSLVAGLASPTKSIGYCQLLAVLAVVWTAFALAKVVPSWPMNANLIVNPWYLFKIDLRRTSYAFWPGTILWGASFTLALAAVTSNKEMASKDDAARVVGNVYAANTAGAIAGALAFSMFLIPGIGTLNSERVLIVLSCIGALCCLGPLVWPRRARIGDWALSASLVVAGFMMVKIPAVSATVMAYGRQSNIVGNSPILFVGEGMNTTIAISRYGNSLQFHTMGRVEATNNPYDMRVERMLGDVPALFHRAPRKALVVGFGAGITAGSFVMNPGIQRIVICEIEPLVPPTTTRYFGRQNYNVLHDPRTQIVFDDARNFLLTTREAFDIITSDPIHPWIRGSATLYTKEYFQMVRKHLNPGGVVAQWVPLYETDEETVKSEIATFFDVFPNGTIWANEMDGGGYDVLLLGQTEPLRIDIDDLQQRLSRPDYAGVAQSLSEVGLGSAAQILGTYAGRSADLKPWLAGAQINRDGNLRLEYLAGLAINLYRQDLIYDAILQYRRFPTDIFVGDDRALQFFHQQQRWQR